MATVRMSAEERRATIIAAAVVEFARAGFAGTSTEAIAERAGISQPYLFRLFGTKKDLFIAANRWVGDTIEARFAAAADGLSGAEALHAMGAAYLDLLADPNLLQVELHGFAAAAADPDIAAACRASFDALWHLVHRRTGLDDEAIRQFFAQGMLLSVMCAIDLLSVGEPWAQSFCPDPTKIPTPRTIAARGAIDGTSGATTSSAG